MSLELTSIERVDRPPTDGLCKGEDPNMWFPYYDKDAPENAGLDAKQLLRSYKQRVSAAKTICDNCHGKIQCLSYGLYHEQFGIWGGATEGDRDRLRKKLNIQRIFREPVTDIPGMNLHAERAHNKRIEEQRKKSTKK
jgi:hypothetical protein